MQITQISYQNFNIRDYISFSTTNMRSYQAAQLLLMHHSSNTNRHFFFHRISCFWNSIPIIDLTLSVTAIKIKLADHFWNHFVQSFDVNDHSTLCYLCPCSKYYSLSLYMCQLYNFVTIQLTTSQGCSKVFTTGQAMFNLSTM